MRADCRFSSKQLLVAAIHQGSGKRDSQKRQCQYATPDLCDFIAFINEDACSDEQSKTDREPSVPPTHP